MAEDSAKGVVDKIEETKNGDTTTPKNEAKSGGDESDDEPIPAQKREPVSEVDGKEKNSVENETNEDNGEKKTQELDDDQNAENPAYIPKAGKFYMHDDDRRGEEDPVLDELEEKREMKKSRADGMWKHDRFDEKFQRPKSKKQIVTKYGFDIRDKGDEDDDTSERKETAAESNADDSDGAKRKTSSSRGRGRGRRGANRGFSRGQRRPLKQREREETVDDSEEQNDVKPAQRRPSNRPPKQTSEKRSSQSSEDLNEQLDDVKPGQRRVFATSSRRGFGGSRLRGRLSAPNRKRDFSKSDSVGNSYGSVKPRTSRGDRYPVKTRGTSRSADKSWRREDRTRRIEDDKLDDRFENHRRGVIRGSGVSRGSSRGVRGATRGSTRGGRPVKDLENGERYQRGNEQSATRGEVQAMNSSRGGFSNNRGGYTNGRGGYTNGNAEYPQGNYPRKNYPAPVQLIPVPVPNQTPMPPLVSVGVVPTSMPQTQMPRGNASQMIRQPTDVVYFNHVQPPQQYRTPPPRERKVIPIVNPNSN